MKYLLSQSLCLFMLVSCSKSEPKTSDGSSEKAEKILKLKPATGFQQLLEAEAAGTISSPFVKGEASALSSGACIRLPLAAADARADARLRYSFEMDAERNVDFWFRCHFNGDCANSFRIAIPGYEEQLVSGSSTIGWQWIKGPENLKLKAGKINFEIKARDADIAIDQILISDDQQYVPQGIEE